MIARYKLAGFTLVGVLLIPIKEWLIYLIVLATYKQTGWHSTKFVPCEANGEKQGYFLEQLGTLLETLDNESVVYFANGVHPTHNTRSTHDYLR